MRREPARAIGSTRECQMILKDTRSAGVNQGTGHPPPREKKSSNSDPLKMRGRGQQFACRRPLWDDLGKRRGDVGRSFRAVNRPGGRETAMVQVQVRDVTEVLNRDFLE